MFPCRCGSSSPTVLSSSKLRLKLYIGDASVFEAPAWGGAITRLTGSM